jgi:P27 family predicted phage terminase small subunit
MPDNVRALRGTHLERKAAPTLDLPKGTPHPPASLKGEGLAEWKRIVPLLESKGILSPADRAVITLYCQAWARACEADRRLLDEGLVIVGGSDRGERAHPAYATWRQSASLAAQLAKELMMTPAVRLRTTVPEASDADKGKQAALLD